MNCHSQDKKSGKKSNPLKHMLMMALCCGLPVIVVGILPLLNISNQTITAGISAITPFLCPLMMIFMIPMVVRGHKDGKGSCCSRDNKKENIDTKSLIE